MSKKQLRIRGADAIRTKAGHYMNQPVNLVCKNDTVHTGKLVAIDDAALHILNGRLKKVDVAFSELEEFYVDIDA